MADLATIVAKIEADASRFNATIDKVEKKSDDLSSAQEGAEGSANSLFSTILGGAGAALVAIGGLIAVYLSLNAVMKLANDGANKIIDANKFARSIGDSVTNVIELQSAIRQLGGSSKDVNTALETMAKTVSRAQSDSTTKSIFTRMGIEFEKFKHLKPSDQFIQVAEAISKLPTAAQRAAIATQLFGKDAANLLPLLNKGAIGIAELRQQAQKYGQTVSEIDANSLEGLQQRWDNILQQVEGIGMQLAATIAPLAQAFLESIVGTDDAVGNITDGFKIVLVMLSSMYVLVMDIFDYLGAVPTMLKVGFAAVGALVNALLAEILEQLVKLPKIGKQFEAALARARNGQSLAGDDLKKWGDELDAQLKRIEERDPMKFLERAKELQKKQSDALKRERSAGGAVPYANNNNERLSRALDIIRSMRTPLEKFKDDMAELNLLLNEGAIDWMTYAKASYAALNGLSNELGDNQISFGGATRQGSNEAYSAYIRSNAQDERYRETPEKRMERLQNIALDLQRQQLKQQEKTAEALAKMDVVKI